MLTAREVYQILRDASVASRSMRRITTTSWDEIYCGLMTVDVDGWVITLFNDCGTLDYCDSCYSPDGRKYDFNSTDLNALDPIELLRPEEHRQLEELLSRIIAPPRNRSHKLRSSPIALPQSSHDFAGEAQPRLSWDPNPLE